jgi:hypothetical protein
MHCSTLINKTVLIATALNIVLPMLLKPYATPEESKPPQGAAQLSMKGQFMHMMVHHNQVPLSSTMIVGLIVYLSMYIAYKM